MALLRSFYAGWRGLSRKWRLVAIVAGALLAIALAWQWARIAEGPQALLDRASHATPERASRLYDRLAQEMPELSEYCLLWSAQLRMPSVDAVQELKAVCDFRPNSPAAYGAHLALARYYAGLEADQAVDAYLAALALDDQADLRIELARHLEERGDLIGAYEQYRVALGKTRIDAFADMRRTAPDSLVVARDLYDRYFFSDVVDVLRDDERCEAHCLRAKALFALGRQAEAQEAEAACRACQNPGPMSTAEPEEAPEPEGAPPVPEPPLIESDNPVERWSGTWDLDQSEVLGRRPVTDVLPVYLDVARSGAYVSDDAAYRALVLAQRRGDTDAERRARDLLAGMQPNWYAWLASGELALGKMPPFPESAVREASATISEKVAALALVGRDDLALDELRYAARLSDTPELVSWAALALQDRGEVQTSFGLAVRFLAETPYAAPTFWQLAYPRAFESQVLRWATEYEAPPNLIWAVMRQESQFEPLATSSAGAVGLMQVMPANVADFNQANGTDYTVGDIYRPEVGIRVGAEHLGRLLRYYEGDTVLALMAYNAGAGNVDAWVEESSSQNRDDLLRFVPYGETREYVGRVGLNYQIYASLYGEDD